MEEVWDLGIPGIWKECVSSLCRELSLHCHCLNIDFKAPVSPADDRLFCGMTRAEQGGSQGSNSCPLGQGLPAAPDRVQLAGDTVWDLLCVPGAQLWQYLAAVNSPGQESPRVAPRALPAAPGVEAPAELGRFTRCGADSGQLRPNLTLFLTNEQNESVATQQNPGSQTSECPCAIPGEP